MGRCRDTMLQRRRGRRRRRGAGIELRDGAQVLAPTIAHGPLHRRCGAMCALHRRCGSDSLLARCGAWREGGHASVRPQSWHGIVLGCEHVCGVCVLGYPRAPCHVCVLPPTPPYLAWSCLGSASYLMPACMPPTPCIIHGHAHVPVDAHRPLASEYVWGGGSLAAALEGERVVHAASPAHMVPTVLHPICTRGAARRGGWDDAHGRQLLYALYAMWREGIGSPSAYPSVCARFPTPDLHARRCMARRAG